jgi:F-type H+-transporting ATPase subunit delta
MNTLRIARTALRARPAAIKAPLQRRGYAEAVSDKVGKVEKILLTLLSLIQIKLSLALPHQVCSEFGIMCIAMEKASAMV